MLEIRVMDQVIIAHDLGAAQALIAKAVARWERSENATEMLTIIVKNLQYKAPPASLGINVAETPHIGEAIG